MNGENDGKCIRCDAAPAVDENGYCGHCHWAVRAEVETGLYELKQYLAPYLAFTDWNIEHGGRYAL